MPPYAKKSLGQHFLKHDHICDRIAALVQAAADDWIIEIGPGPGALTRAVERLPHARLFLLEKDDRFARERQQEAADNTQAILTDALRFPWARLSPARSWKIIGNLPYNVASPMIWDMAAQCRALRRAAFMVQKEVGQRLAAAPGNGHYGALSVWVQSYWKPRMEFIVGPGAFSPPPKVDSAVLSFAPLPQENLPRHPEALARLIKLFFQQRRKQLGSIARRAPWPGVLEALEEAGIDVRLRPEQLAVTDFQRICDGWTWGIAHDNAPDGNRGTDDEEKNCPKES